MLRITTPMTGTAHFRSNNHLLSCRHQHFGSNINQTTLLQVPPKRQTSITRNCKSFDQENVGPDHLVQESVLPKLVVSLQPLLKFAASNFLPSGLTLRSEEIGEAAEAWPVGLFGLVSILLLTPLLSKIIVQVRLQPQEFVTGLALYNCMPTAISSGVALTRLAGGNSALALAMTVLSSLLGILIVPFSISRLIAGGVGASVPADEMFRSLIVTILIPLIIGKVFRESFKGMSDFVDSNRKHISALGVILLSLIPWVQVSKSRPLLLMVKPEVVLVPVLMGAILHLVLLCFNAFSIQILCAVSGGSESIFAKEDNYKTLLLVASQKTVSVLVAVVEQLGGTFGEAGLLVLPCVAAHISQVIIDSLIVGFWNKRKQSYAHVKVL